MKRQHFILAPDSFKGSLSSIEVGEAMKRGLQKALPQADYTLLPMADGGEGTVDALLYYLHGEKHKLKTKGPLGETHHSMVAICPEKKLAIIESASIVGLTQVPEEQRNPRETTSFGIGEAIRYCLDQGIREFIIGLGGSATNDGGIGLLEALGVSFKRDGKKGRNLKAKDLSSIQSADLSTLDPRIKESRLTIASDVDNPLCGERGASAVFGPQKGAHPEMVKELDQALTHYAKAFPPHLESLQNHPGAGAAGGLGFGFLVLDAKLQGGAELIAKHLEVEKHLQSADLLITGEGMTDYQTMYGKAPFYLAKKAKTQDVPVILLSGGLGKNYQDLSTYIDSFFSITQRPVSLQEAIEQSDTWVEEAAFNIGQLLNIQRRERM